MRSTAVLGVVSVLILFSTPAFSLPILQLYVEGGTYNAQSNTWVVTGGNPVRLWCIGNVAGEGGMGAIEDVRLAIAYENSDEPVSIAVVPATTYGYGGFTDTSTSALPTYLRTVTDGSAPMLADGTPIDDPILYNEWREWQEFSLGDFALTDSPLGNFVGGFPEPGDALEGQINVYEVYVSGTQWVHFDLYDATASPNRAVGVALVNVEMSSAKPPVPEPGTISLIGLGVMVLVGARWRWKTAHAES